MPALTVWITLSGWTKFIKSGHRLTVMHETNFGLKLVNFLSLSLAPNCNLISVSNVLDVFVQNKCFGLMIATSGSDIKKFSVCTTSRVLKSF